MAELNDNSRESKLDAVVLRFIEAQSRGGSPDVNELIRRHPDLEPDLRQRIASLTQVDSLFDALRHADASDFQEKTASFDLVGHQIGGFKIVEVIGQGGMGIVYKAQDTRLDRLVAIKTMPEHLVADEAARARFRREARVLASLNHPNIAVIHDIIEQGDGAGYLILEYVPGETLAERIGREPVKLAEALSIGQQIAEAVSAAHERGIVHRDLKPGNIKLTPDDRVKVLDFGLAKAAGREASDRDNTITQPGRVIGTPAYMSPEQARGTPADRRTDIWSFGCIMYQMLTGHPPFESDSATDTLARIIEREPDWDMLPETTPMNIRVLLRRCLEKDPRLRLQHIGDAAIEIRETLSLPAFAPPVTVSSLEIPRAANWHRSLWFGAFCLVVGAVLAGVLFWSGERPITPAGLPTWSFVITPETKLADKGFLQPILAFSPDGKCLAYVEQGADRRKRICVRHMSELKAKALAGTEGAASVFFSPDGEWVAYFDSFEKKLEKVPIRGGEPMLVCECNDFYGGSWAANETIVFSPDETGLWSISASGKGLRQLTIPDPNRGERAHYWPQILPGGEHVLFTVACSGGLDEYEFAVCSLETETRQVLFQGGSNARYVASGHIVYAREETVLAVGFDLERLSLTGPHVPVIQNVAVTDHWLSHFTVAHNGSLAYIRVPGRTRELRPVFVSKRGQTLPLSTTPRDYHSVSISPDGTRVLFDVWHGHKSDIWIYDMTENTLVRFTSDESSAFPIWAPNGKHIIFQSQGLLFRQKTDGSSEAELLTDLHVSRLTCCSPDGQQVLVTVSDPNSPELGDDIWVVALEESSRNAPFAFIQRSHDQRQGVWSSDGRWVAYASNETGAWEVYVAPYGGPGSKIPISTQGGQEPVWSRDGTELYYRSGDKLIAATIETEPGFKVISTQELFEDRFETCLVCKTYDVGPDGRFVMIQDTHAKPAEGITVVLNWFAELERLVPADAKQ
jgi:serine/threonine-protein kinase